MEKDSYYTIGHDAVSEIRERSSRFIAYAYVVKSAQEAEAYVSLLRSEHHSARHWCYAYRIGVEGAVNRANDDGEPSGTAGRPIMGRLLSAELSDVLVVVVRYFGGILLGTSGLISAYSEATTEVLACAGRVEVVKKEWVSCEVDFAKLDRVMKIAKQRELKVAPIEYIGSLCQVSIEVRKSEAEGLKDELDRVLQF